MRVRPDRPWRSLAAACVVLVAAGSAGAQIYPSHPLSMIVPFPAGGATDTVARFLGERMRASLGQPIVIENVGGAAGSIAVGRAARAAPDGYTLSIGTLTTHVLIGGLYPLSFDLIHDLEPVAQLAAEPLLIVGRNTLPAHDLKELITYLTLNPGKATAGIAGVGATGHLTGIAFQRETGTRFAFVPYRGNGPAMQDLLAGQIDFMIEPSSNFRPLIRAGSVKPYAVTAATRLVGAPEIPTVDEAGLPGFHSSLWYGLWVPKETPKEIISKLNATLVEILADTAVKARFQELGLEIPPPAQQEPEALGALQKADAEKWWPIIKAAGIKSE